MSPVVIAGFGALDAALLGDERGDRADRVAQAHRAGREAPKPRR